MSAVPKHILDSLDVLRKSYDRRDPARIEERHRHIMEIRHFTFNTIFYFSSGSGPFRGLKEEVVNTLCRENAMVTLLRVLEDDYYFREYAQVLQVQVCYTYTYISHYTFPSPRRVK